MQRPAEFYKKKLEKLRKEIKEENKYFIKTLNNMRDIQQQEAEKYESEIHKLNQLIGIMKTGRIKYEAKEYYNISNNLPIKNNGIEKVTGVIFLKEIQQVENRIDHVLIVTNSGREICLGKDYDYLENLFY